MAAGETDVLERVRDEMRVLGGSLPELEHALAQPTPEPAPGPALGAPQVAASGPRTAAARGEYELLLELIREGYLLHYGRPRVLSGLAGDLALIVGDGMYARGLARLAALGDLPAVGELGDLISLVAQAQIRDDPELAEAVWTASAVAVGWGADEALREAKERARSEDPAATRMLLDAAERRRAQVRLRTPADAPAREGGNL